MIVVEFQIWIIMASLTQWRSLVQRLAVQDAGRMAGVLEDLGEMVLPIPGLDERVVAGVCWLILLQDVTTVVAKCSAAAAQWPLVAARMSLLLESVCEKQNVRGCFFELMLF